MAKYVTTWHYPPIPARQFDYSAQEDGAGPGDLTGWGRTEAEALADLIEQRAEKWAKARAPFRPKSGDAA